MKLYDIENGELPKAVQHGGPIYTATLYECETCTTRTNVFHMNSTAPLKICPGQYFIEHDEINRLIERHDEFYRLQRWTLNNAASAAPQYRMLPYLKEAAYIDLLTQESAKDILNRQRLFTSLFTKIEGTPLTVVRYTPVDVEPQESLLEILS